MTSPAQASGEMVSPVSGPVHVAFAAADRAIVDQFLDSDCYNPDNPVITHFLRRRFDKVLISFPDGTSDA